MEALTPFTPSKRHPWNRTRAAHLLERAGFGGSLKEIDQLVQLGLDKSIDRLLHPEKLPYFISPPYWLDEASTLRNQQTAERQERQSEVMSELQAWWLRSMIESPRPLEEKLSLFWHSHFATSAEKVNDPVMMYEQHQTLRKHALGPFPLMVLNIAKDPAMIKLLDSESNVLGKPNENFARELMELYTMGEGNGYSEKDVMEAARAFTGWTLKKQQFYFNSTLHDTGEKAFLGKTASFTGEEVIQAIMQTSAAATFLPTKLFRFFAHKNPSEQLQQELADHFSSQAFSIRETLRAIFTSEAFYSDESMGTQIKSPVQLIVGTYRKLDVKMPDEHILLTALKLMGQELLWPPDVNGWKGGEAWINTNALIMRYQFAHMLTTGEIPQGFQPRSAPTINTLDPLINISPFSKGRARQEPSICIDLVAQHLFARPLPRPLHLKMTDYLGKGSNGARVKFDLTKNVSRERLYSAIYLLMSSTEFQLS